MIIVKAKTCLQRARHSVDAIVTLYMQLLSQAWEVEYSSNVIKDRFCQRVQTTDGMFFWILLYVSMG